MCRNARDWAWMQVLPPTPKLVLLALAEHAGITGACELPLSQIAACTGLAGRTVRAALRTLEAGGYLQYEPGSGRRPSRHRLRVWGRPEASERAATDDAPPRRVAS